jgi:hypothetical protein
LVKSSLKDTRLSEKKYEVDIFSKNVIFHVLTSYFSFISQFCDQTDGMDMGLPLSPVIVDFFTEGFEEVALSWAGHKSLSWFHYVNDTFIIWRHGSNRLKDFLATRTSVHHRDGKRWPLSPPGHTQETKLLSGL